MTLFDWMDRHWFVAGWCAIIVCAGLAAILHGIGKRIAGRPALSESSDG